MVVVGPHPARVAARAQAVGEGAARPHVAAGPREAGHVGAVGAHAVAQPVEVHGVRPAKVRVGVAEGHDDVVAHPDAQERSEDALLVGGGGARASPSPGCRRGRRSWSASGARDRLLALDRVVPVRGDVPGDGHGRDPERARAGGRRRHGEQRERTACDQREEVAGAAHPGAAGWGAGGARPRSARGDRRQAVPWFAPVWGGSAGGGSLGKATSGLNTSVGGPPEPGSGVMIPSATWRR